MTELQKFITWHFGRRCLDYDEDCPCCYIWQKYDEFKSLNSKLEKPKRGR